MANIWRTLLITLCASFALAQSSVASSLALSGKERWLVVASSKDLDTAIGISGIYASERAKVVSSKSGWFAVVLGPYAGGDLATIVKAHPDIGTIPKDALLSRGEKYLDVLWQEKPWEEQALLTAYGVKNPGQFSDAGLSATVEMTGTEDDPGPTIAKGSMAGKPVFEFSTSNEFVLFGADAGLLKLDPTTREGQLVFTRFTGGAHCCTRTWIATAPEGAKGWVLVDAGVLDGGGYSYEDADGDGAMEMLHVDNSFLYAFDSYAGSFAPIRVKQLRGPNLVDVSNRPEFRPQIKRDLARMEFEAKLNPDLWKENGFLAGWVAAKQRLGQGEDAWSTALENLNPQSDFGPQTCKTGQPVESCAFDDLVRVPVGKALAQFLSELDYGELPPRARALLD